MVSGIHISYLFVLIILKKEWDATTRPTQPKKTNIRETNKTDANYRNVKICLFFHYSVALLRN
tara:strand:+ start:282 stop:470 length:189 start_codon:yes stop_codon:yes gene_type:complete